MPLAILAAAILARQDPFPPTPAHRWATDAVSLAIREGILPEYTNGLYRTRIRFLRSRFEYAVYTQAALSNQTDRTERAIRGASDVERASLLRARALLPFYWRAAREFASENGQLDIHPEPNIARLESLVIRLESVSSSRAQPFRDVPPDHWAAKAVGDLRALGLLDGYPNDRFSG